MELEHYAKPAALRSVSRIMLFLDLLLGLLRVFFKLLLLCLLVLQISLPRLRRVGLRSTLRRRRMSKHRRDQQSPTKNHQKNPSRDLRHSYPPREPTVRSLQRKELRFRGFKLRNSHLPILLCSEQSVPAADR